LRSKLDNPGQGIQSNTVKTLKKKNIPASFGYAGRRYKDFGEEHLTSCQTKISHQYPANSTNSIKKEDVSQRKGMHTLFSHSRINTSLPPHKLFSKAPSSSERRGKKGHKNLIPIYCTPLHTERRPQIISIKTDTDHIAPCVKILCKILSSRVAQISSIPRK